jgi:hypothetical protein
MSQLFTLCAAPHRTFGALATLVVAGQPERRFTRQEAAIVSRALNAVAQGTSSEKQIYMSPIASDHDFEARVAEGGITVVAEGRADAPFGWDETRNLAQVLAAFSAE